MDIRITEKKIKIAVLIMIICLALIAVVSWCCEKAYADIEPNYLTFTAEKVNSTVSLKNYSADSIQYCVDGVKWIDYTEGKKITLLGIGDMVQFRGLNVSMNDKNNKHFCMTGKIAASGSVTSLLDNNGGEKKVILSEGCCLGMFYYCKSLKSAPKLPATTLADKCYRYMFAGCTNLKSAPKLPATTLADECYFGMFADCTSLKSASELPATTLANWCYDAMFSGCKSLKSAPKLPATTLADGCYAYMFCRCKSLKNEPELPATTLAKLCYCGMFSDCKSLTKAPKLPATTLVRRCYYGMFENCTNLKSAPKLPATTLADDCYWFMFKNCQKIKMYKSYSKNHKHKWSIPKNATIKADWYNWNSGMFKNTGGNFTGGPKPGVVYYQRNSK